MTEETALSPEEFDSWIPAADVLRMFSTRPMRTAARMIADRLVSGLLRSAARHASYRDESKRQFSELEDVTWYGWAYDADEHFWASGDTRVPIDSVDGIMPGYEYSLMDVRFDPAGLWEMGAIFPAEAVAEPISPPAASPRHPGGAPAKRYWEALMFEMLRQYADGKLTPIRQADVERAMLDWLSSQGHEASERSVRTRAKQVWEAIKTEGQ